MRASCRSGCGTLLDSPLLLYGVLVEGVRADILLMRPRCRSVCYGDPAEILQIAKFAKHAEIEQM